jgi:hypothetical protein
MNYSGALRLWLRAGLRRKEQYLERILRHDSAALDSLRSSRAKR